VAKEGKTAFVFYDIVDGASPDAFQEHEHPGGEFYFVVEGEIYDENGSYPAGSVVWMPAGSKHTPRARGKTLIFVGWPLGVVIVKKD
jgi:anti-sigma factor ChrR (cupin superfamily)